MAQSGDPQRKSILDAYPDARRRSTTGPAEEPASSTGTWIKLGAAIIIMVIAGIGAIYTLKALSGSRANTVKLVGDDVRIAAQMEETGVEDVETWLRGYEGRMVMGMSREQALGSAQRLKQMGAKNVFAFKASMMTMSLVIELPDDPAKRGPIFEWYRAHSLRADRTIDTGQKYLQPMTGP